MIERFSRRELLGRAIGAAALWGVGRSGARADADRVRTLPDRSAGAPTAPVAIGRCESYQPGELRARLDAAFRRIGGLDDLVRGKTVTIKLNLTGEVKKVQGRPAWDTYQSHPGFTSALCALLSDAGARRIVLVESFYYQGSMEEVLHKAGWDTAAIRSAGGQRVSFENTRNLGPFRAYSRLKVPWGGFIYPAFELNQRYEKTDVFVSLAKWKDHLSAGVTMAVKNLFGITPCALYGDDAPREESVQARMKMLHFGTKPVPAGVPGEVAPRPQGFGEPWQYRVPRVTADAVGARPIDLAVIDGIYTMRGGEGYWHPSLEPIRPGLVFVGRNAVCTDAIATAAMGYDPQAGHGQFPFPGENHLRLLAQAGVGTIDPARIEVRGLALKDATFPFRTKPKQAGTWRSLPRTQYA